MRRFVDHEDDQRAVTAYPDNLEPLERLILRENCLDILRSLEPHERIIAALRLERLSDVQIGQILGIDRTTVSRFLTRAQERIMRELHRLLASLPAASQNEALSHPVGRSSNRAGSATGVTPATGQSPRPSLNHEQTYVHSQNTIARNLS